MTCLSWLRFWRLSSLMMRTRFCSWGTARRISQTWSIPRCRRHFGCKAHPNVVVGTVEGWPTLENAIDELRALGAKHIELRPMMLVAGDHAQNDMAGDDADSWKSHLTAAGFDVHCTVEGLGELEDVQRLYVEHLKAELK